MHNGHIRGLYDLETSSSSAEDSEKILQHDGNPNLEQQQKQQKSQEIWKPSLVGGDDDLHLHLHLLACMHEESLYRNICLKGILMMQNLSLGFGFCGCL
jgi:hypothetical protein